MTVWLFDQPRKWLQTWSKLAKISKSSVAQEQGSTTSIFRQLLFKELLLWSGWNSSYFMQNCHGLLVNFINYSFFIALFLFMSHIPWSLYKFLYKVVKIARTKYLSLYTDSSISLVFNRPLSLKKNQKANWRIFQEPDVVCNSLWTLWLSWIVWNHEDLVKVLRCKISSHHNMTFYETVGH